MKYDNKAILNDANAFVSKGDYEQFLNFFTDDTKWEFVGEQVLEGKQAVRNYIAENYMTPPIFSVDNMIAEGDYVTVTGKISLTSADGKSADYHYCDVWKFRDGKIAEGRAFVIAI